MVVVVVVVMVVVVVVVLIIVVYYLYSRRGEVVKVKYSKINTPSLLDNKDATTRLVQQRGFCWQKPFKYIKKKLNIFWYVTDHRTSWQWPRVSASVPSVTRSRGDA